MWEFWHKYFETLCFEYTGIVADSMILAECIFSQSATGEVSSAYFRKLAIPREVGCANFRKRVV